MSRAEQGLLFRLEYHTASPAEILFWQEQPMQQVAEGVWQLFYPTNHTGEHELSYNYSVRIEGQLHRVEPPTPHHIIIEVAEGTTLIADRWREPHPTLVLTQPPLAPLVGMPTLSHLPMPKAVSGKHTLLFEYHQLYEGELRLCGATPQLGSWQVENALPLTPTRSGWMWQAPLTKAPTEYKLVLKTPQGTYHWEEGNNRVLSPTPTTSLSVLQAPTFAHTALVPRQVKGTVVPIFALRSKQSYGIGDFGDAVEFLAWLEQRGHHLLQLLPFYDTTFTYTSADSYPYNSISTYGLHPIYMQVTALPYYKQHPLRPTWEEKAISLNHLPQIAYDKVLALKTEVMDACFEEWYKRGGATTKAFQKFCQTEGEELQAYALFCAYRDAHKGTPVAKYPPLATLQRQLKESKEVTRYAFRQFILYSQLLTLRKEADKRNILLKGDLPIGVGRNSVDVWLAPHLFHLDKIAGAPPDAFSATGQAWGFPTYNWEAMQAEGYQWWQSRLRKMERYLHAIRIDHILGFFRIWSIPLKSGKAIDGYYVPALGYSASEVRGLEALCTQSEDGLYHPQLLPEQSPAFALLNNTNKERITALRNEYYYHRNEQLWRTTAIERLTHIMGATNMIICAEDLGMLPGSIQEVLTSLQLFSLEVVRMPKKLGSQFVLPAHIPQLSVLCTSTHDMPTLRGWWGTLTPPQKEELARTYHFEGSAYSEATLVEALQRTASVLLVLPLQDWLAVEHYGSEVPPQQEQINVPDNPNHVWNYRMYGTIRQLPK